MTAAVRIAPAALAAVDLPSDAPLWERRLRALNLRYLHGRTFSQIGDELGVSTAQAERYVKAAAKETCRRPIDIKLDRQHAVLNELISSAAPEALSGDNDARVFILKCLEHGAKLDGLYAPARVQVGISETEFAHQAVSLLTTPAGQTALRELAGLPAAVERPVIDSTTVDSPPRPGAYDDVDICGAAPEYAEVVELPVSSHNDEIPRLPGAGESVGIDDSAWSNL